MIPRRALSALAITVFALALLLSFKTPETPSLAASDSADTAIVGQPAATALFHLVGQLSHRLLRDRTSFAARKTCFRHVDGGKNLGARPFALLPQ